MTQEALLIDSRSRLSGSAILTDLLILGSLIIVPTLDYMTTGAQSTVIHERRTGELYAADAGAEKAAWQIMSDNGQTLSEGAQTNLSSFSMNDSTVNVTLQRMVSSGMPSYQITSVATTDNVSTVTIESHVYYGNKLFDNGLASGDDITIAQNCSVDGDIYYEGDLNITEPFSHNGTAQNGGLEFPSDEENNAFALEYELDSKSTGNITGGFAVGAGTSVNMGPVYIDGNLDVGMNSSVNFTATVYVTGAIVAQKDAIFTGTGSIIAEGSITIQKVSNYGTAGDSMIMSLNGDIYFKKDATINALIYAPNGTIEFDKDASVTGSVVAGHGINIKKDGGFNFEYNPDIAKPGETVHIQGWKIY